MPCVEVWLVGPPTMPEKADVMKRHVFAPIVMPVLLAGLMPEAAWSLQECDEYEMETRLVTCSTTGVTSTTLAGNDGSLAASLTVIAPGPIPRTSLYNASPDQDQNIFKQAQQEVQVPARGMASDQELASVASYEAAGEAPIPVSSSVTSSSAAGINRARPIRGLRTFGAKYFLLNGLHLGMASADVALTQHCIADHRCREGNPLMPSSLAGSISIDTALVGFGAYVSRKLQLQGSSLWWLVPVAGIAAHGAGVATGIAHQ